MDKLIIQFQNNNVKNIVNEHIREDVKYMAKCYNESITYMDFSMVTSNMCEQFIDTEVYYDDIVDEMKSLVKQPLDMILLYTYVDYYIEYLQKYTELIIL